MKGLVASSGVLLFCLASASPSAAYEPRAAHFTILQAPRAGEYHTGLTPGGDVQVLVGLQKLEELSNANVLLVFPNCGEDAANSNRPILNLESVLKAGVRPRYADWSDPGPRWRVCASDSAVLLSPNSLNQVTLLVDFLRDVSEGESPRLPVEVHVLSEDDMARIDFGKDIGCQWANIVGGRRPTAEFVIDLYFRVDGQKHVFFLGDYQSVFGAPDPDPLFGRATGDYNQIASQLPVDVLSFRSNRKIPAVTEDDGGAMFKDTLAKVLAEKSALTGTPVCNEEDIGLPLLDPNLPGARPNSSAAPLAKTQDVAGLYHVSGRFSTKWTADHSLHPGFGFRVEAWSNDFFGVWIQLAADWVQADGTWSLTVPGAPIFSGHTLRIYYRTKTSYYDVQSLDGNHYVWVDPDWTNIPATFSVGHRFADTDGGTYNGIGELVDAAMYNWSRLYWDGGINPVPASPINIFAPNTTYDCGDGSGNPWSCANRQGNLWLIAAHAVRAEVVAHELGHQLNYKFWNYKNPANTGGSHSLNTCYPGRLGTTLFEGFADFMAGWTGYPGRNVADGGFGSGRWKLDWDLESRTSPPDCTNGWENEVWVARNFWDLHDTRSDGNDVLWFNHLGAVPVIYLANGVANDGDAKDMRDFENAYRNAASAGHQTYISNIFRQNRQ